MNSEFILIHAQAKSIYQMTRKLISRGINPYDYLYSIIDSPATTKERKIAANFVIGKYNKVHSA